MASSELYRWDYSTIAGCVRNIVIVLSFLTRTTKLTFSLSLRNNRAQPDPSLQLLNNLVVQWAWAQAAATLSPSLQNPSLPTPPSATNTSVGPTQEKPPQLNLQNEEHKRQLRAAYEEQQEEQQRQLRSAYEQRLKEEAAMPQPADSKTSSREVMDKKRSPAQRLQRGYEAHLKSIAPQEPVPPSEIVPPRSRQNENQRIGKAQQKSSGRGLSAPEEARAVVSSSGKRKEDSSDRRKETTIVADRNVDETKTWNVETESRERMPEDSPQKKAQTAEEEAGTILVGFLNSLRQSFEDAVEEKTIPPESKMDITNDGNRHAPVLQSERHSISISSKPPESKSSTKSSSLGGKRSRGQRSSSEAQGGVGLHITSAPRFPSTASRHRALRPPASVTDTSTLSRSETSSGTSSQRNESSSSLEDSDSKSDKTDPSSSEESEKDCSFIRTNKGPPRKRLKAAKQVTEFTTQNLREHSKRMGQEFTSPSSDNSD
jgi:hypothetical protein